MKDTITFSNIRDPERFVSLVNKILDPNFIAEFWHTSDVQSQWDVTTEQARQVLQHISGRNHDATVGINWDTIDIAVMDLFPDAERADEDEDE